MEVPLRSEVPLWLGVQRSVGAQTPVNAPALGQSLRRGAARALLAGPGALAAALGLTGLVALRAPWLEADRLVAAGFVLPVAWAVGAVWATMDRKLARVAVGLCVTAVACVGGAIA